MNRTKLTSLLLALVLALSILLPGRSEVGVEALERMVSGTVEEEKRTYAGESADIAAIEIADLDAPWDGAPLDASATLLGTKADGTGRVSWHTPVIWTDPSGALVETARAGDTLTAFITLFVPEGCNLVSGDLSSRANLVLPDFLSEVTETNGKLYFLEAPTSGLVFLSARVTVPGARRTASPARGGGGEKSSGRKRRRTPHEAPEAPLPPELMVHTDEKTVKTYGPDYMKYLIETVKNVVEPQAVNMLIEAFPVYRDALNRGALSSGIGFFVEKQESTIAYIRCAPLVFKSNQNLAGKALRLVVNADFFAEWDPDRHTYKFNESRRADLEFTMTHELLHAMMYDHTPNGMLGVDDQGAKAPENRFPAWFTEGAATAVDNAYRYRRNQLLNLCLDIDRYEREQTAAVSFTPDRMIDNYRRLSGRYDINGGASGPDYAYTSGYLASMYLMQLASEHVRGEAHVAGRERYQSGDMREGFNYILGELQSGRSLDQIIATISPTDASGAPIYGSIADFQSRFLAEGDRDFSATFCANFLKYLNSLAQDGKQSWGCILIEFDDMRETLFDNSGAPVDPLAYRIGDEGGYVRSDAPVDGALDSGGATLPGPDGLPVAAKPDNGGPGIFDGDYVIEPDPDDGQETPADDPQPDSGEPSGEGETPDGDTPGEDAPPAADGESVGSTEPGADGNPGDATENGTDGEPADVGENGTDGEPADAGENDTDGEPADAGENGTDGEPTDGKEPGEGGEPAYANAPGEDAPGDDDPDGDEPGEDDPDGDEPTDDDPDGDDPGEDNPDDDPEDDPGDDDPPDDDPDYDDPADDPADDDPDYDDPDYDGPGDDDPDYDDPGDDDPDYDDPGYDDPGHDDPSRDDPGVSDDPVAGDGAPGGNGGGGNESPATDAGSTGGDAPADAPPADAPAEDAPAEAQG